MQVQVQTTAMQAPSPQLNQKERNTTLSGNSIKSSPQLQPSNIHIETHGRYCSKEVVMLTGQPLPEEG